MIKKKSDSRTGVPSLSVWVKIDVIVHTDVHKSFITHHFFTCEKYCHNLIIVSVRDACVRVQRTVYFIKFSCCFSEATWHQSYPCPSQLLFLNEMSGSDQSGRRMMSNHTRKDKGDSNDNDLYMHTLFLYILKL